MKPRLTFTSAVVAAALSLPVLPAVAQQHRGGGNPGGGGRVASAPRMSFGQSRPSMPRGSFSAPSFRGASAPRSFSAPSFRGASAPRSFSAPSFRGASAPRSFSMQQGQPRSSGPRTSGTPQAQPRSSGPRTSGTPQAQPRSSGPRTYGSPQAQPRTSGPRTYGTPQALPRTSGPRTYGSPQAVPRANGPYRGGAAPGSYGMAGTRYGFDHGYSGSGFRGGYRPTMVRPYFSHDYVRPYGWRPYYPFHFVRPYYVFSPWLDLGFGIWCGYPVPYPWVYLGDYQPTVFGDYDNDSYQVVPGAVDSTYGGVSFDMQPADANLFIDGQYVGVVGSFGSNSEPLTLEPGPHKIAIQRDGYRSLEWDVTIVAGQVIPYRGALERQ